MRTPATISRYDDIDGLADFGIYALEAVMENSPQLLIDLGIGAVSGGTATLGKEALAGAAKTMLRRFGGSTAVAQARVVAADGLARSGFMQGAKAGAFASMYVQSAGETQSQFMQEGIDAPEQALAIGGVKAALEYGSLSHILGGVAKKFTSEAVEHQTTGRLASMLGSALRTVGAAAHGVGAEGTTEMAQTFMDELATAKNKQGYDIDYKSIIDAGIKGGIVGAGMSGAGHLAAGASRRMRDAVAKDAKGNPTDTSGISTGIPAAGDGLNATAAEPLSDIRAQITHAPEGQGNWYTAENAEAAKAVAEETGKAVREHSDGSVSVGTPEVVEPLTDAPTQQDIANLVGYHQTKDAAIADTQGQTAVRVKDADGNTLSSQIVGNSVADEVVAKQTQRYAHVPGGKVEKVKIEDDLADRKARLEGEKVTAADVPALIQEAEAHGIDTSLYLPKRTETEKTMGDEAVARLRQGIGGVSARTRIDDASIMAPLLGLSKSDLVVSRSNGETMAQSRTLVRKRLEKAIEAQGGDKAVADKIDALPRHEAGRIKAALGLNTKGGVDVVGLRRAISERQMKEPADVEGTNPLGDETQDEAPKIARKPTLQESLVNKTRQIPVLRQAVYKVGKNGQVKVRDAEEIDEALETMTPAQKQQLMDTLGQWGIDGQHRTAFTRSVAEAMMGRELTHEHSFGSQIVEEDAAPVEGDETEDGASEIRTQPVPTVEDRHSENLRKNSHNMRFLDTLSKSKLSDAYANGDNAGLSTYLNALAHVARANHHDTRTDSSYGADQHLRTNRAHLLATAVDELALRDPLINREAAMAAIVAKTGYSSEDVVKAMPAEEREALKDQEGLAFDALNKVGAHGRDRYDHRYRLLDLLVAGMNIPESEAPTLHEARTMGIDEIKMALRENPTIAVEQMLYYMDEATHDSESPIIDNVTLLQRHLRPSERDPRRDAMLPRDEQQMSDETFFGAVQRAIASNWDQATIPSNPEDLEFGKYNGTSRDVTRAMQGRNLLELTLRGENGMVNGVIDAVALARIAQSGESVPANVGEAAANLLTNIARMVRGPQSNVAQWANLSLDETVNAGFSVPDSTVVYVNPVTGKGMTFGEGMKHRFMMADGRGRVVEASAERRRLSSHVDNLSTGIAEAIVELETARANATDDTILKALNTWLSRMRSPDETLGQGERLEVVKEGRPAVPLPGNKKLQIPSYDKQRGVRQRYDQIGKTVKVSVPVYDQDGGVTGSRKVTLDEAYNEYLSSLSEIKQLSKELEVLREDKGLKADPLDDDESAAMAFSDADLSPKRRAEAEADYKRGGGLDTEESPDHRNTDENPNDLFENRVHMGTDDPLAALGRAGFYDNVRANQTEALESLVAALNDAPSRAVPAEKPATFEIKAQGKGVEFVHSLPEEKQMRNFLSGLRAKGVPLPELRIASYSHESPLEVVRRFQLNENNPLRRAILRGLERGESFYVKDHTGRAYIVLARRTGARGGSRALLDLAHELGHAVKDQVWSQLTTEHRESLEAAFMRDHKKEPTDHALHEWFADQFAQVALEHAEAHDDGSTEKLTTDKDAPLVTQAIQSLAKAARAIWNEVKRHIPGVSTEFREFAHSLFGGTYEVLARQPGEISAIFPNVRYVDGHTDQAPVNRARMAVNSLRQNYAKGTLPGQAVTRSLTRMVITRIADHSPELASMLFQKAGQMGQSHGRAYEQHQRAINGRLQTIYSPVLEEIRKGAGRRRILKDAAVREAFEDVIQGEPKTANGKKIRAMIDSLVRTVNAEGLRSGDLFIRKDFVPVAFDRQAVISRQGEFMKLLEDKLGNKMSPDERRAVVDRIVDGVGFIEGAIAPGMPVGQHESTQAIIDAVGRDELLKGNWMLRNHDAALNHWISGVSKRTAWENKFGGEELTPDGESTVYSPNAKFNTLLGAIRRDKGDMAAQEVLELVNGALGRHPSGQSMPAGLRKAQDTLISWIGFTTLAFSGIASIPELGLPMVRAAGKVGLFEAFKHMGEARNYARDMNIVMSDASEQLMWQMMGDQYESSAMTKASHWFFKLNGNQMIVRASRILGTSVAMRYLLRAAEQGDTGSLRQLNIDAGTIKAWEQMGKPVWREGMPADQAVIAAKVADAINQFVNEATLSPSRFQATHWGNNPYAKTIWHLKQFLFTYGDTVLGYMARETARRWKGMDKTRLASNLAIMAPMLAFGLFVLPLGLATMTARDWIKKLNGQKVPERDPAAYVKEVFASAGGLGPLNLLDSMRQSIEWGRSPLLALSPTWSRVDSLFTPDQKTETLTQEQLLKNLSLWVPIVAQNPGLNPTRH
ncbi:hypothetical protein VPH49_21995 [Pseudomonas luteola]|uniref:ImmA/IrrE family metallo-endopeptidase n=1 Tax=Pseudomonas luteola TaxID=47886 RepID=UPI003A85A939